MLSQTPNVRVFLRNLDTGLFLKVGDGKEWAASTDEAHEFKSVPEAIDFATKARLGRLEAFLVSGEAKGGICLPDPDSPEGF